MAAIALTERYAANLHGVLSCYDRIIVTGTLPGVCYAGGMTLEFKSGNAPQLTTTKGFIERGLKS